MINQIKILLSIVLIFGILCCETDSHKSTDKLDLNNENVRAINTKDSLIVYCNSYTSQSEVTTILSCDTFLLEFGEKIQASTIVNYYLTDGVTSLMKNADDFKYRDTIDSELIVKTVTVFNSVYMVIEHIELGVLYMREFIDFTKHEIYVSNHPYLDSTYLNSRRKLYCDYFTSLNEKLYGHPINIRKSKE